MFLIESVNTTILDLIILRVYYKMRAKRKSEKKNNSKSL
jgi:hypothetical protein